jgi:two-component system OmpR family response regulator
MRAVLAEDDALLADALSASLRNAGFEVEVAGNGAVAEYLLGKPDCDLGIVDIGLPLVDGLTVVRRVRAARPTLPLLILTALDGTDNRVTGLNAGADDYLTKPFDFPELEARITALLRRASAHRQQAASTPPPEPADEVTVLARLHFDRASHRATVNGSPVDLSPREWLLLDLLVTQQRKVTTKEQIAQAWSSEVSESGSVASLEVYIHRLRRKLDGSGLGIRTVRGLGYLLEAQA